MSISFIGEIKMLPYAFSPQDWAYCNGQLQAIAQNQALFAIIGDYYGGNGRDTMGLPNLMGRSPLHVGGPQGAGPGLSVYRIGEKYGFSQVELNISTLPSHDHGQVKAAFGSFVKATNIADNQTYLGPQLNPSAKAFKTAPFVSQQLMDNSVIGIAGSNYLHNNRQPYLVIPFCICLDGIFPSRN